MSARDPEESDAGDEGRLVPRGSTMVAQLLVNQGNVVCPSQLISSVRPPARWTE